MKTHTVEHIKRTKDDIRFMKGRVEFAVSLSLMCLRIKAPQPLKVIYADVAGVAALWSDSPQLRAAFGKPLCFFTQAITLIASERTLIIRTDLTDWEDGPGPGLSRIVPAYYLHHLIHSQFSREQVETLMAQAENVSPWAIPWVEALNDYIGMRCDWLGALFSYWVRPVSQDCLPPCMTEAGLTAFWRLFKRGGTAGLDVRYLPLTYPEFISAGSGVFALLVDRSDECEEGSC
jgi:hypothetical protein